MTRNEMIFAIMIANYIRGWLDLSFPDICLTVEENPRKTSTTKADPTEDRTRARYVRGNHVKPLATAVVYSLGIFILFTLT